MRIGDLAGIGGGYNVVLWEIQDGRCKSKFILALLCAGSNHGSTHMERHKLTSNRMFTDTERLGRTATPKERP